MLKGGDRFYFDFEGKKGLLPQDEAHHAIRVCRKKEGEKLLLINGKGKEFLGKILKISDKKSRLEVEVEILEVIREEKRKDIEVIALIPLLKGDKTEFLIEKGTELGIDTLLIYQSTHTIPKLTPQKMERFRAKALSALKQSGRLYLPTLLALENLLNFLTSLEEEKEVLKILASPEGEYSPKELYVELSKNYQRIYLLSGPEGGLSQRELEIAEKKGFFKVKLSPYILRSETASFLLMSLVSLFMINS